MPVEWLVLTRESLSLNWNHNESRAKEKKGSALSNLIHDSYAHVVNKTDELDCFIFLANMCNIYII